MPAMLPHPTVTFTIPSLHDGIALDCRLFHPKTLFSPAPHSTPSSPNPPPTTTTTTTTTSPHKVKSKHSAAPQPWTGHAAILAHPYAPLGGSQDDPVVDAIGSTLLRQGFLLATFNFRGAGTSAGRTSWTSRAERADYASVAGFVHHYVHFLLATPSLLSPVTTPLPSTSKSAPTSPLQEPPLFHLAAALSPENATPVPVLLFGGYSYGAMITGLLPPHPILLAPFSRPTQGTPAAEIRLRAEHLAVSQVSAFQRAHENTLHRPKGGSGSSHRRSLGVRIGGGEDVRRASTESRRSFSLDLDRVLHRHRADKGVEGHGSPEKDKGHRNGKSGSRRDTAAGPPRLVVGAGSGLEADAAAASDSECLPAIQNLYSPRVAYLLVSPPIGVMTSLATFSFATPLFPRLGRSEDSAGAAVEQVGDGGADTKLMQNPSLLVYGDADGFASLRKARTWAGRLMAGAGTEFVSLEVGGAGHFWTEVGVLGVLRESVADFTAKLVAGQLGQDVG